MAFATGDRVCFKAFFLYECFKTAIFVVIFKMVEEKDLFNSSFCMLVAKEFYSNITKERRKPCKSTKGHKNLSNYCISCQVCRTVVISSVNKNALQMKLLLRFCLWTFLSLFSSYYFTFNCSANIKRKLCHPLDNLQINLWIDARKRVS